jgi:hypothetical protein
VISATSHTSRLTRVTRHSDDGRGRNENLESLTWGDLVPGATTRSSRSVWTPAEHDVIVCYLHRGANRCKLVIAIVAFQRTFGDFAMLIQLERQLTSTADHIEESASESGPMLSSDKILKLAREDARRRYGLSVEAALPKPVLNAGDPATMGPDDVAG